MDSIPLWLNYLLDLSSYNRKGKSMKESNDNAQFFNLVHKYLLFTLPTAEILSGKNARAWVSMVLYLKK